MIQWNKMPLERNEIDELKNFALKQMENGDLKIGIDIKTFLKLCETASLGNEYHSALTYIGGDHDWNASYLSGMAADAVGYKVIVDGKVTSDNKVLYAGNEYQMNPSLSDLEEGTHLKGYVNKDTFFVTAKLLGKMVDGFYVVSKIEYIMQEN